MPDLPEKQEANIPPASHHANPQASLQREDRVSLLETIIIFCISAASIIFVFAMSAAALGDYQFRLPEFLTDSAKTLWSLVAAGGVAVTGSAIDLALRRQPRTINYVKYILATTALLFLPIVGLLLYGRSVQNSWTIPPGASSINILGKSFPKRSFSLSFLVLPAPVGFFVAGEVTLSDGHLKGTAYGRITKGGFPIGVPPNFIASQVSLHLCYYQKQIGSQFVSTAWAPRFPQSSNAGPINVPIPMTTDAVDSARFPFDIEIPELAHPEAVWLCAFLTDRNNYTVASLQ